MYTIRKCGERHGGFCPKEDDDQQAHSYGDVYEIDEAICGRCLITVNVATNIVAKWGVSENTGQYTHMQNFHAPTNPLMLKEWVQRMWYINSATFDIDEYTDMFKAIATFNGDPVCQVHLRMLVHHEMTGKWW